MTRLLTAWDFAADHGADQSGGHLERGSADGRSRALARLPSSGLFFSFRLVFFISTRVERKTIFLARGENNE